jgi:lipopolysaccharide/colanic/teichoic acid biosynthesis glycosyltransferase
MNGKRAMPRAAETFARALAVGPVGSWADVLAFVSGGRPRPSRRVLVGRGERADRLREELGRLAPGGELRFLDVAQLDGRLVHELERQTPDEVYFDLDADLDERMVTSVGAGLLMDGAAVHFVFSQPGRPPVRATASSVGTDAVISLHAVSDGPGVRLVRRVVDVLGSAFLLVLLAPLFAVVTALVWAKMGRPIFHAQERLGIRGRRFRLFKFRSMVVDAEAHLRRTPGAWERYVQSNFKLPAEEDTRITPLGRMLRRTSLDELPQLWNVLRGDMGLVGPRAIVPDELAEYGDYGRMLLRVKPGLTGLWQVSGRSAISYPERARIDLRYVEGRTLGQDLRILLRTLPAVVRQRGAL